MIFDRAIGGFAVSLVYGFLLMASETPSRAQEYHLDISGFGDAFYSTEHDSADVPFSIGQIELDLDATLGDGIEASAALAYDPERGTFDSGQFFLDFNLFGLRTQHLRPVSGVNHTGIIAGQFDVPFGIDWEVYASIDRKLVSVPLVVENTHHQWNDVGVQVYADTRYVDAVAYGVNGFSENETKIRYARGGRLGLKPLPFLEFGASLAGFVRSGGKTDMRLAGADTRMSFGPLAVRGEYITRKRGLSRGGDAEITDYGYYLEGLLRVGRGFLAGRYDSYTSGNTGAAGESRTCAGVGWALSQACETRLEYQLRPNREDIAFLQVAAAF